MFDLDILDIGEDEAGVIFAEIDQSLSTQYKTMFEQAAFVKKDGKMSANSFFLYTMMLSGTRVASGIIASELKKKNAGIELTSEFLSKDLGSLKAKSLTQKRVEKALKKSLSDKKKLREYTLDRLGQCKNRYTKMINDGSVSGEQSIQISVFCESLGGRLSNPKYKVIKSDIKSLVMIEALVSGDLSPSAFIMLSGELSPANIKNRPGIMRRTVRWGLGIATMGLVKVLFPSGTDDDGMEV